MADMADTTMISRRAELQDCNNSFYKGKVVLVRVDYNVPIAAVGFGGEDVRQEMRTRHTHIVTDDTKIRASLPTIQFLISAGAKVVLCSHMGRPPADMLDLSSSERLTTKFSLHHVLYKLVNLLENSSTVSFSQDCVGPKRDEAISVMHEGDVLLLENTRFHTAEEENNDPAFAMALASKCEIFVMDAFSSAHRAHASVLGTKLYTTSKIALHGLASQRESDGLSRCIGNPARPFAAVIGGAKMSSKLPVIRSLLSTKAVDKLVIGGAMAHTFLLARGTAVGASLVEDNEDMLVLARFIMHECAEASISLVLPVDFVLHHKGAPEVAPLDLPAKRPPAVKSIPQPDGVAMDIGPLSVRAMINALQDCKTILWNGPLGHVEIPRYAWSTNALADWMVARGSTITTVIAGGDTVAAVGKHLHIAERTSVTNSTGRASVSPTSGHPCRLPHDKEHLSPSAQFSHMSLAGGAALEFLKGRRMPGLEVLSYLCELPRAALTDDALGEVLVRLGQESVNMKAASAIERHAHQQAETPKSPAVSLVPCDLRESPGEGSKRVHNGS